jgi:hypothetical protein
MPRCLLAWRPGNEAGRWAANGRVHTSTPPVAGMIPIMTVTNRAALIGKVHKVLKKHYTPAEALAERTILEHLLYACCLENARPEAADEAFARLQQAFFDWNEVRVTTVAELAEHLANLPRPQRTAQQIKRALQSVFESNFAFDLEPLVKQNLGKSEKDIEKHAQGNPFLIAYVVQHGLGGHAIPCCQGVLDALMCLAVVTPAEVAKLHVPGLERAIPKNKGLEFASLLHQLGADFAAGPPFSPLIRQILAEIDPDSKDRLPKRQRRDDELAVVRQQTEDREALVRASLEKAGVRDDAKTPAGKEEAGKESGGKVTAGKESGKESGGKEISGKESGGKESGGKESGGKVTAGKEGGKEPSSREHATAEPGAKEPGAKEHGAKEHGAKEHGAKEHGAKEHGAKEHGGKGHGKESRESKAKEGGKTAAARESASVKAVPSRDRSRSADSRSRAKDADQGKRKSASSKSDSGKSDSGKADSGKHDSGKSGSGKSNKSKRSTGKGESRSESRNDERRADAKKLAKKKPR